MLVATAEREMSNAKQLKKPNCVQQCHVCLCLSVDVNCIRGKGGGLLYTVTLVDRLQQLAGEASVHGRYLWRLSYSNVLLASLARAL